LDPSWLFLAGVAVLTTMLVRMTYRRRGPARGGSAAAIEPPNHLPSVSPAYRELLGRLETKEVEFNDLSREAMARLDNKIAILQRLLAEADAKIARLEGASVAAGAAEWERGKGGEGE
jgi:hypothetical protein